MSLSPYKQACTVTIDSLDRLHLANRGATLPLWVVRRTVAHVDFVDHQTGLEDDGVWDHGIVMGIGVLDDVEIFLHNALRSERKGQCLSVNLARLALTIIQIRRLTAP